MSTVRLRPTFRLSIAVDREDAIEQIRGRLAEDKRFAGRWRGKGRWAEIYVPHSERRLWSPYVSLRLDRERGNRCTVFGRFAPHPEVWTFFIFLYIALSFGVVFGAVLGYVQWASSESPTGLLAVAAGLPAIALIHAASALGQRLGQKQMTGLKEEVMSVLAGLDPQEAEPAADSDLR